MFSSFSAISAAIGALITVLAGSFVKVMLGRAQSKKTLTDAEISRMQAVAQIEKQEFDHQRAGANLLQEMLAEERRRADAAVQSNMELVEQLALTREMLAATKGEIRVLHAKIEQLESYIANLQVQLAAKPCHLCSKPNPSQPK